MRVTYIITRLVITADKLTPTKLTEAIRDMMNASDIIRRYGKQKDFTWCNVPVKPDQLGDRYARGVSAKWAKDAIRIAHDIQADDREVVLKERGVQAA